MNLLSYKKEDTLKIKFVVVSIWLYAILFIINISNEFMLYFRGEVESSLVSLGELGFFAFISIFLLFKSKIARFITLVNMYAGLWLLLVWFVLTLYFIVIGGIRPFIISIPFISILFVGAIIYLFINKEALKLFEIEKSKKEFYWLIGLSVVFATFFMSIYFLNHDINYLFES